VDYTIHFLWRYRSERGGGLKPVEAVQKSLTTTGRGIVFNAFSVIFGFCALPFSMFSPLKIFGFLVIATIFICLVGALVIVPALVLILRPSFLEPEFQGRFRGGWNAIAGWLKGRKAIPTN
jgi:predicted RND superfamily exporter protein